MNAEEGISAGDLDFYEESESGEWNNTRPEEKIDFESAQTRVEEMKYGAGESSEPEISGGESRSEDENGEKSENESPKEDAQAKAGESTPSSLAGQARKLLEEGLTPNEVAKVTGMGRSAVELLSQMMASAKK